MARLKKRKDDRYRKQVYLGRKPDGTPHYQPVYGRTQAEAEEKAAELKVARRKGLDISARRDAFQVWGERLVRLKEGQKLSNGRIVVIRSHLAHFNRYFGNAPISEIRLADIQDVLLDLADENPNTGKPTAEETLRGMKSTARQVFDLAIDNRVIEYNPALRVHVPNSGRPNPRRALRPDEQSWIVETDHRAQVAAMIMTFAGLRRGEVIPLMPKRDIDLDKGEIHVSRSVEFINGKAVLKDELKTEAGRRVVHIPKLLVDYLRTVDLNAMYITTSAKGQLHTESSWKRMWESYLSELNYRHGDFSQFERQPKSKFDPQGVPFVIPRITPHWMRHTFATLLYLSGVDVITAKDQMGHKDIKTTLEIYTHLDHIYKRDSMRKLDNFLDSNFAQIIAYQKGAVV